jgi:hypothetical protein
VEKYFSFQIDADTTTSLYVSIHYFKEGRQFYWDSPWIRKKVQGEVAELDSLFLSNTYGKIGRQIKVEATIKGLGDSDGFDLYFWVDTPSGKIEELAKIKTKKLANGENVYYTTEITPKEEGYYTIYANLYNNYRRIGRESDTLKVEK